MISILHPNDTAICEYGICTVINAIKWRENEIFAYRVRINGESRIVDCDDIKRIPSTADLAWAADMVRRVITNTASI